MRLGGFVVLGSSSYSNFSSDTESTLLSIFFVSGTTVTVVVSSVEGGVGVILSSTSSSLAFPLLETCLTEPLIEEKIL